MASFVQTINPTAFHFFDADPVFQTEADAMVTFVQRKLGSDVLSVELTKRQIWCCFEEAILEYARLIHEMKIQNDLISVLGLPTGSTDITNLYIHPTFEFLIRQAEPYATEAAVGGNFDATLGFINIVDGQQDYNIYRDIMIDVSGSTSGTNLWESIPSGSRGRMRILDVLHFDPVFAQQTLLNASNITNFLANNFNYESYVNSTVFYVLPVFEDVLRRGMLETAMRVRRSNFSYELIGSNLRLYPIPSIRIGNIVDRVYVKVFAYQQNPLNPNVGFISGTLSGSYGDNSIYGVSGPSNFPVGNIPYGTITAPGRQWIREYTLALCKELLGLVRSKFKTLPVPNAEVTLNGEDLISQGREEKKELLEKLREWLSNLTNAKLVEAQVSLATNLQTQLRLIPIPLGKAITIG